MKQRREFDHKLEISKRQPLRCARPKKKKLSVKDLDYKAQPINTIPTFDKQARRQTTSRQESAKVRMNHRIATPVNFRIETGCLLTLQLQCI